jgi:hypothetical protein
VNHDPQKKGRQDKRSKLTRDNCKASWYFQGTTYQPWEEIYTAGLVDSSRKFSLDQQVLGYARQLINHQQEKQHNQDEEERWIWCALISSGAENTREELTAWAMNKRATWSNIEVVQMEGWQSLTKQKCW